MVDRLGATVSPPAGYGVPRPEAVVPSLGAGTVAAPYVISGVWTWFGPGVIGVFAVALPAGAVGAAIRLSGVVLAALGAAAVVGFLARIKVVIDEDGIAVCDGLLRRLRWAEIVSVRDGRRSPS